MSFESASGSLTAILGVVMLVSSLGAKFIGMPRQIKRNFQTKTAPHGLQWFMWFGLVAYASQTLWCTLHEEWLLAAGQAPGVITTSIFVWQIVRYADAQPVASLVCRGTLYMPDKAMQPGALLRNGAGMLVIAPEVALDTANTHTLSGMPAVVEVNADVTGAPFKIMLAANGWELAVDNKDILPSILV